VLFAGRDEHHIARLDRDLAAFRVRRSLPRQHVDAFLEAVVKMRAARLVTQLRDGNFGDPAGHP
jgi:hypothetical protein